MPDRNQRELENGRPKQGDEADSIRRFSGGDDNRVAPRANQNINRIQLGGTWALIFGVLAMILAFSAFIRSGDAVQLTSNATGAAIMAAESASKAQEHGQSLDNRMREVVMEKRLLQEDMIMLRAALRAHGVNVETSGDHE
jgi:hypothetical protein